ncbi:MAG: protein kinase [Verrucomicrobiia bacterium]
MESSRQCRRCRADLTHEAREDLCPRCLILSLAQAEPETEPQTAPPPTPVGRRFGDYELLEEVGRGGMGVVFKARQCSLNRMVAVKMLAPGVEASPEFIRRLRTEATAAACLHHPHIVAVHEVGVWEQQHYFAMDFVAGPSLAQLAGNQPMPPRRAAGYLIQICEAVHHAHEHGILHRDLKPSNILIDAKDQPQVTDFGLARRLEGASQVTLSGQVVGSPPYMPPEQLEGRRSELSRQTDVYALGAMLYQLLTGRPPYVAADLTELMHLILKTDPVSPRLVHPAVPRDLETVCLKCLEKEPGKRYATAQELGEELERFLNDEPIRAQPLGTLGRGWRWCRRNPRLAAVTVGLVAAVLLGGVGITRQWLRAEAALKNGQRALYAANINLLSEAWNQNNPARVRQLLDETAGFPDRGFEWFYWQRQMHRERRTFYAHRPLSSAAFSPDAQRIATASHDGTATLWDTTTGRELLNITGHRCALRSLDFSPDGERLVTAGDDGTPRVWDAKDGHELLRLEGHRGTVWCVDWSPVSQQVVTAGEDRTARIWDAVDGRELFTLRGHGKRVWTAAFSADGQRIVTSSLQSEVRVWDASNGCELLSFDAHDRQLNSIHFSPDGEQLVGGGSSRALKIWEAATGKEQLVLEGEGTWGVEFSMDGRRILSGGVSIEVLQADTGTVLFTFRGHLGPVRAAKFSRDGRWILSASTDQTAKLWDVAAEGDPTLLRGHAGPIMSLAFSPDGQRIVTGGRDQTVRVWEPVLGAECLTLRGHGDTVRAVAFSPDGKTLVSASEDQTVRLWAAATGSEIRTFRGHRAAVMTVAFDSIGQRIVTGDWDGHVKVWAAETGQQQLAFQAHAAAVNSAAFLRDGQRLVTGSADGTARLWQADQPRQLRTFRGHAAAVMAVALSPNERLLVAGSSDGTARVWEMGTGRELLLLQGHRQRVTSVAFSPDGQRLATAGEDGVIRLWDVTVGNELMVFKAPARCVAFSSDGRQIAAVGSDGTGRVWSAATWEQVANWQNEANTVAPRLARLKAEETLETERQRAALRKDPGAIREWLVLAPLPVPMDALDHSEHQQMPDEAHLQPVAGQRVQVGLSERVWRAVHLSGVELDFNALLGQTMEGSAAYAVCYLQAHTDLSDLVLWTGSDDQSVIYLNGERIHHVASLRTYVADQDKITGVKLKAGENVLVFKVINGGGPWLGSVRFTDSAGQPLKGIHVSLEP